MYVTFPAPPPPPPPVPPPRPCRPVLPPPSPQELNFDLWYLAFLLVLVPVMEVFVSKDLPQQQACSNEGLESMGLHVAMGLYQGYIRLWGYIGLWGYSPALRASTPSFRESETTGP